MRSMSQGLIPSHSPSSSSSPVFSVPFAERLLLFHTKGVVCDPSAADDVDNDMVPASASLVRQWPLLGWGDEIDGEVESEGEKSEAETR
mmetsp:Transcript_4768/g.8673  ORF Transcript_4768/g.8673 Transcript_4768/m.8673 type:complete len:89 (-) Transcript_4768:182-448(-)